MARMTAKLITMLLVLMITIEPTVQKRHHKAGLSNGKKSKEAVTEESTAEETELSTSTEASQKAGSLEDTGSTEDADDVNMGQFFKQMSKYLNSHHKKKIHQKEEPTAEKSSEDGSNEVTTVADESNEATTEADENNKVMTGANGIEEGNNSSKETEEAKPPETATTERLLAGKNKIITLQAKPGNFQTKSGNLQTESGSPQAESGNLQDEREVKQVSDGGWGGLYLPLLATSCLLIVACYVLYHQRSRVKAYCGSATGGKYHKVSS